MSPRAKSVADVVREAIYSFCQDNKPTIRRDKLEDWVNGRVRLALGHGTHPGHAWACMVGQMRDGTIDGALVAPGVARVTMVRKYAPEPKSENRQSSWGWEK